MTVGSIVKKKTKAESRGIPHMTTALKPERGRGFQKYPKFADKQDIHFADREGGGEKSKNSVDVLYEIPLVRRRRRGVCSSVA